MSSIVISGNTSGTVTLAAPDVANTTVITLPATSMTLSSITCRAWVKFSSLTTIPVISASYNVSSITDNGVGDFTINFTTAMPDVNYTWSGGGCDELNTFATNSTPTFKTNTTVQLTSSSRIQSFFNARPTGTQYSNGVVDLALVMISYFR